MAASFLRRRRAGLGRAALLLAVAVAAGACGDPSDGAEGEVRAALDRVAGGPRGFVYKVQAGGVEAAVEGYFEDDYRFKARLLRDGAPVLDQVVSDDALALRFVEPSAVDEFAAIPSGSPADPFLRSRRWVVDPEGAPADRAPAAEESVTEQGALLEGLRALDFVRAAVAASAGIARFNEESLDYRPREDPFPKPEKGAGVTRYDIRRPPIPARDLSRGGDRALPGANHFRKMAVYLKDGVVVHVLEVVEIETRLDEVIEKYELRPPPGLSRQALGTWAIGAVNERRAERGMAPIVLRTASLDLVDIGVARAVALPDDATTAPVRMKQVAGEGAAAATASPSPSPAPSS